MILVLRGHVRGAFKSPLMKGFVEDLVRLFPDLKIYIHTWNKIQSSRSYRNMEDIPTPVTKSMISTYFGKKVMSNVKHIIIDDDEKVTLTGNQNGKINNTCGPILPWKYMWAGKYSIMKYVYIHEENKKESTINTRIDYFQNPFLESKRSILEFIKDSFNSNKVEFTNNTIARKEYKNIGLACDNLYIGPLNVMYSISHLFHFNLDSVIKKHSTNISHIHEKLVYLERNYLIPNSSEYTIIHPPKVGGHVIYSCFKKFLDKVELINTYKFYIDNNTKTNVLVEDGPLHFPFNMELNTTPVTTIRHPIPRFLSMYKYWKNGSECFNDKTTTEIKTETSIKDFINMIKTNDPMLKQSYTWGDHYKPITWFIGDAKLSDLIVLVNDDETNILVKLKQFLSYAGENPDLIKDTNERINVSYGDGDELLLLDYDDICFIHDWYKDDVDLYEKALNSPELFKMVF